MSQPANTTPQPSGAMPQVIVPEFDTAIGRALYERGIIIIKHKHIVKKMRDMCKDHSDYYKKLPKSKEHVEARDAALQSLQAEVMRDYRPPNPKGTETDEDKRTRSEKAVQAVKDILIKEEDEPTLQGIRDAENQEHEPKNRRPVSLYKKNKHDEKKLFWMATLVHLAVNCDIRIGQRGGEMPKRARKMFRKAQHVIAIDHGITDTGEDSDDDDEDQEDDSGEESSDY
jgi:hypothetical protein